jgi:hypothetical protein
LLDPEIRQSTHIAKVPSAFADAPQGHGKPAPTAKVGCEQEFAICLMSGLSQSQSARAFRASMGVSPYRWFLSRTLRLADIAARLGFADQSHFTKAFRRATATTPPEWRRGHRS